MFIAQLKTKQVQTKKYGLKEKWLITDENGKVYESFIGKWNSGWKEGQTIEVKPENITSREYQGKIYYSIKAPPEARGGGVNLELVMDGLRKIYAKLNEIEAQIIAKKL